jgi:mitogen-activated protein kinase kinase
MELDILHRAVAPEIVEFYGAFTIESCVYYCMEYMDAGSLDRMHGDGVPEDVLARITKSMVKGLRFLKDELSVMHRGQSFEMKRENGFKTELLFDETRIQTSSQPTCL